MEQNTGSKALPNSKNLQEVQAEADYTKVERKSGDSHLDKFSSRILGTLNV